jgi:hypothetical protein
VLRYDGEESLIDCSDIDAAGLLFGGNDSDDNTLTYSADSGAYETIAPGAYVVTVEGEAVGSNPVLT